ncbi:DUF190 domain-containing protein [Pseudodesulfovibrio senegalensis]|jgi:hypothetical protein|uniref:DUF190 domain-containing protein n=1 Tax=Pseudodesulfovibrio senegalensis TaxID=1721087 RepID=A0A6N6N3F6_9BACT|nr:DUF190 domain-containing protein [Pseudodesulfovibrio senegalensis]KAB1441208.1 DUF190 domain-containing protein [Pseudodesulfovibrio senegalensis]
MQIPKNAQRLRIFIGETDRHQGRLLSEVIVETARKDGLAGATVLRGIMGYGANSRVHTNKILRLSEDMPIVVEIVDAKEKIDTFLPQLDDLIQEGLVTREDVHVIMYRHNGG